jgi:hypothetical protein
MRKEAVRYWDEIAAQDLPAVRDAMLAGFRSERAFDASGRVDARHLLLPFVSRGDPRRFRRGPSRSRNRREGQKA